MLILPHQTKFSLRSAPLVTIALILVNVFVYVWLQGGEAARRDRALAFYSGSTLPGIELPRYRQWLNGQSTLEARRRLQRLAQIDGAPSAVRIGTGALLMESDAAFRRELKANRIVLADELVFQRWQEERHRFERILNPRFTEQFSLEPEAREPWQWLTYSFLHPGVAQLVANMAVLLLAGAFAEAALGRVRFLFAYLASGAAAGGVHLLVSAGSLMGASGAVAGTVAMVAVLYGTRKVPVFYSALIVFGTARMPAVAVVPVWLAAQLLLWALDDGGQTVAFLSQIGGLAAGALLAWLLRPREARQVDRGGEPQPVGERARVPRSSTLQQAREAAARLDTRRATQLYRGLVELSPADVEHTVAYFNVAMIGNDPDALADAALRVLWLRTKATTGELRKAYLTMSQPRVLQVLPVDEQLRLARRLVRSREDVAALGVLDGILKDTNLRTLYARQTADCLLGLHTAYSRYGLKAQAEQIRHRLAAYFPSPGEIGGRPPSSTPPTTILGNTTRSSAGRSTGPDTILIDLGP